MPGGGDAVEVGHPHVHQGDVGSEPPRRGDGLDTVGGFARDRDVGLGGQDEPESGTDRDRQHRGDGEATARLRAEVERAAVHVGPLSHAGVSVAVRFRRIGPVAVVDDLQSHRGVVHLDQAVQPAGRGVPQHVGHRLLHDPEGGQVETRRQPSEVTDHPQGGLHTGQPDRLEQLAEPGEPGRRFGLQRVDRRTEHPEQPVHLGQRLPSGASTASSAARS